MNYTLHQLQVFLEVVKYGSITQAAEDMNMTQPALSIQLKNFQNQFDQPLTEVVGRKLYVTEFGRAIANMAENVLREAETIRFKTKEYEGLLAGKLSISSASTGMYVIPYFLSEFHKKHPGVDLMLDMTNKNMVLQSLKKNEIDFALVSVIPEGIEVYEEPLLKNLLYLVGTDNKYNETQSLVFRESGSATRMAMDKFFDNRLKRKQIELTTNEAVKQAVIAGLGYSILPLIGIKNELQAGELHIIPTVGLPIVSTWRLIWLKEKKLSQAAQKYLQFIRTNKAQLIQDSFSWCNDFTDEKMTFA